MPKARRFRQIHEEVRGSFPDAAPGDLCYYIPWGDLAFFYGNYRATSDLIRLGHLDGGVEPLLKRGEFPLHIEKPSWNRSKRTETILTLLHGARGT